MAYPKYKDLSILILFSFGARNCLAVPGQGIIADGFSAFILHSIACHLAFILSCSNKNPLPEAISSCCSTMSIPVTSSVIGCST